MFWAIKGETDGVVPLSQIEIFDKEVTVLAIFLDEETALEVLDRLEQHTGQKFRIEKWNGLKKSQLSL